MVGDEIEIPPRRPLGLKSARATAASNVARGFNAAILTDIGDPQLCRLPGHMRQVPGQPGEAGAVGAELRAGIKVAPRQHQIRHIRPIGRNPNRHDGVLRQLMTALGLMALGHGENARPFGGKGHIGKAPAGSMGQPPRRGARLDDIKILVAVIDEHHAPGACGKLAAAIFVNPGAGGKRRRQHIAHPAGRIASDNDGARAVIGAKLAPVKVVAVATAKPIARTGRGDVPRPQRRGPCAVGSDELFAGLAAGHISAHGPQDGASRLWAQPQADRQGGAGVRCRPPSCQPGQIL